MQIKTRFAPSPTGALHVGSVRTALFAWLFAKHHGGTFLLRIEDTDKERSTQANVDIIMEGLSWLALDADEGPYYQSQRYPRYREVIELWLNSGKAYRCYCTQERLDSLREEQLSKKEKPKYDGHCRNLTHIEDKPYVVRFRNPEAGAVHFHDLVYGDITFANEELDDLIIQRTDGNPTYNFTVVIDDYDMNITHVVRGDDHINNTPRQINMLKALEAKLPVYAHLPMILGEDGKKLSKRHGASSVIAFQAEGILPEALKNYLVRLGWAHGDQEIFSIEEMVKLFSLEQVGKGGSIFDYNKLLWLNQHYIKTAADDALLNHLKLFDTQNHLDSYDENYCLSVLGLQKERAKTLNELWEGCNFFFNDKFTYDSAAWAKHLKPSVSPVLSYLLEQFSSLEIWSEEMIKGVLDETLSHFSLKFGKVGLPLRIAVTGTQRSPELIATLALLGKMRVCRRIEDVLKKIKE